MGTCNKKLLPRVSRRRLWRDTITRAGRISYLYGSAPAGEGTTVRLRFFERGDGPEWRWCHGSERFVREGVNTVRRKIPTSKGLGTPWRFSNAHARPQYARKVRRAVAGGCRFQLSDQDRRQRGRIVVTLD